MAVVNPSSSAARAAQARSAEDRAAPRPVPKAPPKPPASKPLFTKDEFARPQPTAAKTNDARATASASNIDRAVRTGTPLEATATLKRELAATPPALRGTVLAKSRASLGQLTERITSLDRAGTAQAVKDLASAADLAGPLNALKLTIPMAEAIADGRLEQKGASANGGPLGVFKGANTHNSEREFIDGIKQSGPSLFRDALTVSLSNEARDSGGARAARADGMAGAVVTGNSRQVPDSGVWTGLRNVGANVVRDVAKAGQRFEAVREQAATALVDKTLGVSTSLGKLRPGDTLTLGTQGQVSAGLVVASGGGAVQVTRNTDGSYTATASASLGAGVGLGRLGQGLLGAGAQAEFRFANLSEARQGTLTLAKLGVTANTATNPNTAAIALAARPSTRELNLLANKVSAIEGHGSVSAAFDARFGLTGVEEGGLEASATAKRGYRIELNNGKPTAVISFVQADGAVAGAAALASVPGKPAGGAQTQGSLRLEKRTDLSASRSNGELLATALAQPATKQSYSATLTGSAEANGHGVESTLRFEGVPKTALRKLTQQLLKGDLKGASRTANFTRSSNRYDVESRGWLDHSLDLFVASGGGTNSIRHVQPAPVVALAS